MSNIIKFRKYAELEKKYRYTVIVGSFQNEDNAKKLASSLKEKYSNANIRVLQPTEEGFHRVVAEDYSINQLTDALELRDVAKEKGFEDAWILITPKEKLDKAKEE